MNGQNIDSPRPGARRMLLVGSGKLAHALALTMPEEIAAVMVRDADRFASIGPLVPEASLVFSLEEIAHLPIDLIWIATSDRAIPEVAERVAAGRDSWEGVTVAHSSGAGSVSLLEPFSRKGGRPLVLHPNASFTGDSPIPPGLLWGVTGTSDDVERIAAEILAPVAPRLVTVADERRPLYHAAASAASNYSLALFHMAAELYRRAGLDDRDARAVVARFMHESVERGVEDGVAMPEKLTGPISRGDREVVEQQLRSVERDAPEYLRPFAALGELTAGIVCTGEGLREWKELFGGVDA